MANFYIKYENPDSTENGKSFLVREDDNFPFHYLISDGKSHVGGGTLKKIRYYTLEYC